MELDNDGVIRKLELKEYRCPRRRSSGWSGRVIESGLDE